MAILENDLFSVPQRFDVSAYPNVRAFSESALLSFDPILFPWEPLEVNETSLPGMSGPTTTTSGPTVSVIIPTLNEAANLPYVLNTIPDWVDEVILVDGRSTDDTERVARLLWPSIRILHVTRPGKGAALREGLSAATSEVRIALDADGSMDGNAAAAFRDAIANGAQYVKGSRFAVGAGSADITPFRRFGDRGICWLIRLFYGARYTDATYGYFAVRGDSVGALNIDTDGFEVETLIGIRARRARLVIAEVPCFEAERIHGTSNLNAFKDGLRIARTIVTERFRRYHRAA